MTYIYIENGITDSGWGVYGVFKLDTPALPDKKDPKYLSVKTEDLIVGKGPGWDDSGSYDEVWLKRACDLINKYGLEGDI